MALSGIFGSVIGGALTDRLGRRKPILFGLFASAVSSLTFGSVNEFAWLFPLAAFVGLFSEVGGPAHGAMIADILPKEQRQEGFGILRVVGNMAWLVGPTVGGFVARSSFFALFVIDAAISCVVAALFYLFMAETRPAPHERQPRRPPSRRFATIVVVLADKAYVAFLIAAVLMGMVYIQMYNSLSVYLRDNHGIQPQGYGVLLTSSAIIVIGFQFWTMRVIKRHPQFLMMASARCSTSSGSGCSGWSPAYWLFVLAVVIITVGEMIVMPTSQTLAAGFARTDMRGRYMALYGLSVSVPAALGPVGGRYCARQLPAQPVVVPRSSALRNLRLPLSTPCTSNSARYRDSHRPPCLSSRVPSRWSDDKGKRQRRERMLLAGLLIMFGFANSAQQASVSLPVGVKAVSFGQAQRYNGPGKEMCAIVRPLREPAGL